MVERMAVLKVVKWVAKMVDLRVVLMADKMAD
jgi:hypothetical protein